MTTQAVATPQVADAADSRWQRLLPLSDLAFVPLFLVGWFMSGGVTPHYSAADQDWVEAAPGRLPFAPFPVTQGG